MEPKLSKSRIMSSLQCRKRVHLEINRKDLVHFSKATEAAFALGGDIAIELARALRGMGIEDGHVFEVEGWVFNSSIKEKRGRSWQNLKLLRR